METKLSLKRTGAIVAPVLLCLAAILFLFRSDEHFELIEYGHIFNVNDVGVVRLNTGIYRWSTNHSSKQYFGKNIFENTQDNLLQDSIFDQDVNLPGFEMGFYPKLEKKPVQIYFSGPELVIESDARLEKKLSAKIKFPWPIKFTTTGDVETRLVDCSKLTYCYSLEISLKGKSETVITTDPPYSDGFPIEFEFQTSPILEKVQLGNYALDLPGEKFTYHSKDRHGLAYSIGKDGLPRFFVSRGGARGEMSKADPLAFDELFERVARSYSNTIKNKNIKKEACPGRQTSWLDVDQNGLLDIYQVCGRSSGENSGQKNRLYIQTEDGTFEELAQAYGVEFEGAGSFKFIPGVNLQLVWVTSEKISFYQLRQDRFVEVFSQARIGTSDDKMSVAFDANRSVWQVLITSHKSNQLFHLKESQPPKAQDLETMGLPNKSHSGLLIDLDGDGANEICVLPTGCLKFDGAKYYSMETVDLSWLRQWADSRWYWFDYDQDGDLDVWIIASHGLKLLEPLTGFENSFNWVAPKIRWFVLKLLQKMKFAVMDRMSWESRLYENRSETELFTIRFEGEKPESPAPFTEIRVTRKRDNLTMRHFVGEDDHSLHSLSYLDIHSLERKEGDQFEVEIIKPDRQSNIFQAKESITF